MKYKTTCGFVQNCSFETALMCGGYTPLGGVFVPEQLPSHILNHENLLKLKDCTFPEISEYIASQFISSSEIPREDLHALIEQGLNKSKFTHPEFIPVTDLSPHGAQHYLFMSETYHSPSLVFKDYSMCMVGQYMNYFIAKKRASQNDQTAKKKINILICTTGDTGSSAIEAFKGLEHVNVVVGFPSGDQITEFQRLQMTTVLDSNIHCFQVERGSCDDIDLVYVDLFNDPKVVEDYSLTSTNSTNLVRIIGQIPIFVYVYLLSIKKLSHNRKAGEYHIGVPVKIVVPTGACGNLCSALFAKKLGLPIEIIVANNSNAFFYRVFHSGEVSVSKVHKRITISNAMDSQWSPSLCRILWLISPECVENYDRFAVEKVKSAQSFSITPKAWKSLHELVLDCQTVCDEETKTMMSHIYNRNHATEPFVVCPHTAVGFAALSKHNSASCDITKLENIEGSLKNALVMATAHPDKFSNVITHKLGMPYSNTVKHFTGNEQERFEVFKKEEDWKIKIVDILNRINNS